MQQRQYIRLIIKVGVCWIQVQLYNNILLKFMYIQAEQLPWSLAQLDSSHVSQEKAKESKKNNEKGDQKEDSSHVLNYRYLIGSNNP
jgi:hypothetical protein